MSKPRYNTYLRFAAIAVLSFSTSSLAQQKGQIATVRRLTVSPISSNSDVELEIATTRPVLPQSQVITSPDRLVIDLPNAVPGNTLHNQQITRGDLTAVRVALFGTNPPVTRVVLDLKSARRYEIVPDGNTIVVKVNLGSSQAPAPAPASVPASFPARVHSRAPQSTPKPPPSASNRMDVEFSNGKLKIFAERVSLAAVLNEVHRHTGTEVDLPPAAGQENVFVNLGPGSTREVLAALLTGSRFNFFMIGGEGDPADVRSLIVTPKDGMAAGIPAIAPAPAAAQPSTVVMTPPEAPPSLDNANNVEAPPDAPPPTDEPAPAADVGPENGGDGGDSNPDMVPPPRPNGQPEQPDQQPPQ